MSALNRFCAKAKRAAAKVSDKAGELVDSASRSVKIKSLEIRMDEQYEALGRLIYRDLHTDEDLEEQKLEIIAAIDALYDELAILKGESDADGETEEPLTVEREDGEEEQGSDAEEA